LNLKVNLFGKKILLVALWETLIFSQLFLGLKSTFWLILPLESVYNGTIDSVRS